MTRKIDAFIVGSYKAGTTSLKNYLSEHPEVISHPQLELDSFFGKKYNEKEIKNKMEKQFKDKEIAKIILAKNTSFYRNENVLKEIKNYNPEAKIIFIVRNPAERAYSSWKMEKERIGIKEEFNDVFQAIEQNEDSFLYKSCYLAGLYGEYYQTIINVFNINNVKLIKYEELIKEPLKICKECLLFLGADPSFRPNVDVVHNKSYKAKNKYLTKIIDVLSSKDNVFKNIIRKILPYSFFVRVKSFLRNVNQSKVTFPPLDEKVKNKLLKLYLSDIMLLEEKSGLDLGDYKSFK